MAAGTPTRAKNTLHKLKQLLARKGDDQRGGKDGRSQPYPALASLVSCFGESGQGAEIVYFGDSVVERVAREDQDQRTLGEMVRAGLEERSLRTLVISHSAYNPYVYYHLCEVFEQLPRTPQVVLFPVNMRCFSPQWDLNPAWQFEQEVAILKAYRKHPEKGVPYLHPHEPSSEEYEQFDALAVNYPASALDRVGYFRLLIQSRPVTSYQKSLRTREIFVFHYMHPLEPKHRKLQYIERSLRLLLDQGILPVLYVTPINYQAGLRYVGESFVEVVAENVDILFHLLKPYVDDGSIMYLDYSRLLDSEYFFHRDLATEHLNERGRRVLADHLTRQVLRVLGEVPAL